MDGTSTIRLLLAKKHAIIRLFDAFNTHIDRLKFTIEWEESNRIQFLDLDISHLENGIELGIAHKKSAGEVYINYASNHPFHQKVGFIKGFFSRAMSICNTDSSRNIVRSYLYRHD